MTNTGNWVTDFKLEQCNGDYVPDIFNLHWIRHGGRAGYSDGMMTLTLEEVKTLRKLFSSTLKKHKKSDRERTVQP